MGLTCRLAENGQRAIDMFVANPAEFSLCLCDYQMPLKNGDVVALEIRAFERVHNLKSMPIVAVSAGSIDQDIRKCLESGMNDYLTKPFTKEELRAVIAKYIPALGLTTPNMTPHITTTTTSNSSSTTTTTFRTSPTFPTRTD
eukprot:TRINITY_DN11053_c0_g4_i4.p2 TRINITY_DN11053_c0_g4~~TRINITY_DN11053_c0_g4_i4.p2  ORF type:complete len:143 (+),score=25.46 TRINITY_DN11053_c0_g4_i4:421-849(+)